MKLTSILGFSGSSLRRPAHGHRGRHWRLGAFTLGEVLTAMTLFGVVVLGVVACHILGLKMFNITATKLSASQNARLALNRIRDDIRGGKILDVGLSGAGAFTNIPVGTLQSGNALKINPTTDTNTFILYYLNNADQTLRRLQSDHNDIIARFITNQVVFAAEDFAGHTLTNDQNNRVIRMTLEFYQWEFPVAVAGNGAQYDYFRINTRVTRRAIE